MKRPHCIYHRNVAMREEKNDPPAWSLLVQIRATRTVFRCRIPGCPWVEKGKTKLIKGTSEKATLKSAVLQEE